MAKKTLEFKLPVTGIDVSDINNVGKNNDPVMGQRIPVITVTVHGKGARTF